MCPSATPPIVTVGKSAQVEVSAYPQRSFTGKVRHVAPPSTPDLPHPGPRCRGQPGGLLKPEMYAAVGIPADAKEELPKIPTGALLVEGVKNYVFVEREAGVFEKREVTLAGADPQLRLRVNGVKGGDKVVSVGALLLNAELASSSR